MFISDIPELIFSYTVKLQTMEYESILQSF